MKKIEVVAGIIICNGFIFCVQRPKNKFHYISEKYEFPGGKIEEGEQMPIPLNFGPAGQA